VFDDVWVWWGSGACCACGWVEGVVPECFDWAGMWAVGTWSDTSLRPFNDVRQPTDGLTESSNNVSIQGDDYLLHPGSVGKLNPVSEMKIVEVTDWDSVPADHVDKEVPVGTVGELCFRGANVIKEVRWTEGARTEA